MPERVDELQCLHLLLDVISIHFCSQVVNKEELLEEGQDSGFDVHLFLFIYILPKKSIWLNILLAPRIVLLSNFRASIDVSSDGSFAKRWQ